MGRRAERTSNAEQDRGSGGGPPRESLSNSSGVFSRSIDGSIISWSDGMQRRYGFTAEQAVGAISHRLLRTAFPIALHEIEAALLKKRSWHGGLIHRHANGRPIMVTSHWVLHRRGARAASVSVTETHFDAISIELADLFAIMANELSQPLTAIASYVGGARRVLQGHKPDADMARLAIAMAACQIERGAAQVQLMRSLAEELRHTA